MDVMTAIKTQGFRRVVLELYFSLITKSSFYFETLRLYMHVSWI